MPGAVDVQNHITDTWTTSTLKRTSRLGRDVYERAKSRKLDWPTLKHQQMHTCTPKDPLKYTSMDDAFSSVKQFMSVTSRQCNKFYSSSPSHISSKKDVHHCNRYHKPTYPSSKYKNKLQKTEDVHIIVQPGSYTISAGTYGGKRQHSHIIHIKEGQTIDVDFTV